MPYIDIKLSKKATEEQKEVLKTEFGKAIKIMHKPESYLMVGIQDNYDLYFAGKKLENGAFVSVSVFGSVSSTDSQNMTERICEILKSVFATQGDCVYVTYGGIQNWGWDGSNF